MTGSSEAWVFERRHGSAASLHGLEIPEPASRRAWLLVPDRPAVVLGSTQDDGVADRSVLDRQGIDLVRRRSGGGAVLLDPAGARGGGSTLWVDLVLPRHDPLWVDDVGRSTDWLGEAWARALVGLGEAATVHHGPLDRTVASALVCFAGLGPGEVVAGGRKVVGISQRRSRAGARFQCVVHLSSAAVTPTVPIGPAGIVDLLVEPRDDRARSALVALLEDRTATIPYAADAVLAALLGELPPG